MAGTAANKLMRYPAVARSSYARLGQVDAVLTVGPFTA
jgi:hypothetical protein